MGWTDPCWGYCQTGAERANLLGPDGVHILWLIVLIILVIWLVDTVL